jgi:hypothetical protein
MEEEEYNDIVTYIQDQKYPQNANESVKRKIRNKDCFYNGFEDYSICHLN